MIQKKYQNFKFFSLFKIYRNSNFILLLPNIHDCSSGRNTSNLQNIFEFLQYLGHITLCFSSKFLFGNKTNHLSLADSLPASENREIETLYQKTNSSQGRLARAYIYPIQQKSFWTNEDICLNQISRLNLPWAKHPWTI